jgi:hypothetical protein
VERWERRMEVGKLYNLLKYKEDYILFNDF